MRLTLQAIVTDAVTCWTLAWKLILTARGRSPNMNNLLTITGEILAVLLIFALGFFLLAL
jgi:hypothetical protein